MRLQYGDLPAKVHQGGKARSLLLQPISYSSNSGEAKLVLHTMKRKDGISPKPLETTMQGSGFMQGFQDLGRKAGKKGISSPTYH